MKVEYFVGDHLGSTSLTTDSSGAKVSEIRYKPCPYRVLREGETRYSWTNDTQTTTPAYQLTRYTFTGQYSYMDDPSTSAVEGFGLMYYGARFYDPALGRFSSPDTIIPESQGTQAWDRYAYVNNDPIRYTDPTGHSWDNCSGVSGGYRCQIHQKHVGMEKAEFAQEDLERTLYCDFSCRHSSATTSSDPGIISGGGGDKSQYSLKSAGLCPDDGSTLYCVEKNLTEAQLGSLEALLSNLQGGFIFAAFFWGGIAGVSTAAAAMATGSILGIPVVPFFGFIAGVSAVAAAGFGYEAAALTDLISYVKDMKQLAHDNGGNISFTYYQGNNDMVPSLLHQFDTDGQAYGFSTLTGLLVMKSQLHIPLFSLEIK